MQLQKARELQRAWGGKPCEHTHLEKEYFLGSDTGDKVCSQCGKAFFNEEDAREDAERSAKKRV